LNVGFRKNVLFNKIFIYFVLAIVCAFCFTLFINAYYITLLQSKTHNKYVNSLSMVSTSVDISFQEILQTTSLLAFSDDVNEILFGTEPLRMDELYRVRSTTNALRIFRTTNSYIQNAYIISRNNELVIDRDGTSSIEEFFDLKYSHELYDMNFWLNLRADRYVRYLVLKPSIVTNRINSSTYNILPIVQFALNDQTFNNIFVVNMNINSIARLLDEHKLTNHSTLFICDNEGNIVCKSGDSEKMGFSDDKLQSILQTKEKNSSFTHENKKYLIIDYDTSLIGFKYHAIVPYEDFYSESIKTLLVPLLILGIGMVIVIALSFLFSKRIYTPIDSLTKLLKENYSSTSNTEDINKNDLEFINKSIYDIIADNKKLTNDLSIAIPYVCERYLLSIFNHNTTFPEQEVNEFLAAYGFTFKHDYFVVIHTTLNFPESFYEIYSKTEYDAVCQDTVLAAKEIFSKLNMTYTFSVSENQICIILNLEHEAQQDDILEVTKQFHQAIESEHSVITIQSGIGQIHEGLNGMYNSYRESLRASSHIAFMTTSVIKCYEAPTEPSINSYYTIEEENKLVNYLIKGDNVSVKELIDNVISKNIEKNISDHSLKELYLQIYNTCVRVLNMRNLCVLELLEEDYLDIYSDMAQISSNRMYKYILLLLENIIELSSNTNNKFDVANLKQYIDSNFNKEIYLDSIAAHFNMTPKYMSKLIKKTLGISFQSYLSSLRISKSKELLTNTSKSISSIAEDVGFNSRYPFIRKFKLLEGITPSEYRTLHRSTK